MGAVDRVEFVGLCVLHSTLVACRRNIHMTNRLPSTPGLTQIYFWCVFCELELKCGIKIAIAIANWRLNWV